MPRKKLTTKEFIKKARAVHGDKYDYSKVKYINTTTKVKIVCPEHGVFEQIPKSHLKGSGCQKCGIEKQKLTPQEFIEKAITIHNDKYDYSLVEYKNNRTKVKIVCPEHGVFEQRSSHHLNGQGCPKCGIENLKLTIQKFIKKAISVHGNKYDYSQVNYKGARTKVKIICSEHGVFEQRPYDHLRGIGCPKCGGNKKLTTKEFIKKAISVHGNKYDYSQVNYVNNYTKVKIVCPEHGVFEQVPYSHLKGCGCPKCPVSISKPEQELAYYIMNLGHEIIQSYRGWCKERPRLEIDIFIPSLNIGFEFNGSYWHSLRDKEYHKEKTLLAINNGIKLVHIWEDKYLKNPESIKRMIEKRLINA